MKRNGGNGTFIFFIKCNFEKNKKWGHDHFAKGEFQ